MCKEIYSEDAVNCKYFRAYAHAQQLTRILVDDFPRGYPLQAAFQSEDSFSIYRSFNYLHARVILQLQDELRALEDDLQILDAEDDNETGKRVLMSRVADQRRAKRNGKLVSDRVVLLGKIHDKLVKYDKLLIKAREVKDFSRPTTRDYDTLRKWVWNVKPLSYEREEEYIRRRTDLITLRPGAEWGIFDGWIEYCIQKKTDLHKKFKVSQNTHVASVSPIHRGLFIRPVSSQIYGKFMYKYFPVKIERATNSVIWLVLFGLFALPVFVLWILLRSGNSGGLVPAIYVIGIFVFFFSIAMKSLTRAKRHELFTATAAYAAVLVVTAGSFIRAYIEN
jgi:hypothetical protein